MSKVAIIGNGNVGYHLARATTKTHDATVFSRNRSDENLSFPEDFNPHEFEFIILAVPDDSICGVAESIESSNAIVLHTSGARPLSDLIAHQKRGVLYPLQTFSKEKDIDFTSFPILTEGFEDSEKEILSFAKSFASDVRPMNSNDRAKLHLAAVFACNFTNHLYHISNTLLSSINVDFNDLQHLAKETLEKAVKLSPLKAQTGPAIRNDQATLENHLRMLENDDWKKIYELISEDIRKSQE